MENMSSEWNESGLSAALVLCLCYQCEREGMCKGCHDSMSKYLENADICKAQAARQLRASRWEIMV